MLGAGSACIAGLAARASSAAAQLPSSGLVVSVTEFGARSNSAADATAAVQAAIDTVQARGGGTVLVPGRYRCGNLVVSGQGVRLVGQGGWLVDARLTIRPEAEAIEVVDLGLVDTRRDRRTYLMDVSGRNCRFENVQLVKDPIAGGYQMYVRQRASGCRFNRLRLRGSNGIMLAGRDHLFENFELESTMAKGVGGDDAFAIKGLEESTQDLVIRNGIVRGYSAIVSFGSEIGTQGGGGGGRGAVRNVTVENVKADRCGGIAFFKPGALIYDWRNGIVEGIRLLNLTLEDQTGERFRSGIRMLAARGATIRNVTASGIRIFARAVHRGVMPTAAVDLTLLEQGAPAAIEDVVLEVVFLDPYAGAAHSPQAPGYPVDHIVRIEKNDVGHGTMSNIVLDIEGRGSGFGGIYVGGGLDGAVEVRRAVLANVATSPPASVGGGGIWTDSRLTLGQVQVDSVKLPEFGGRAVPRSSN